MTLFLLLSCSKDEFSKELLCESLDENYTAKLDFIVSGTERNIIGKAELSRGDISTIAFTEPQEYSGISVTSDETSSPDILSLEFEGIPATVPKSIASELSLMFSLFSDSMVSKIDSLDDGNFSVKQDGICEVFFSVDDMNYKISYSKDSGIPSSFEAGNDEISISIIISDYKYSDK